MAAVTADGDRLHRQARDVLKQFDGELLSRIRGQDNISDLYDALDLVGSVSGQVNRAPDPLLKRDDD
jgi:hypothetical protein